MSQQSGLKSARTNQYARAIIDATVERWENLLRKAAEAIGEDEKLLQKLEDGSVDLEKRVQLLEKALDEALSPVERNLFKLLIQEGDLELARGVADALLQVIGGEAAPVRAEIVSAVELSAKVKEAIRKQLTAEYGENLIFEFRVDPTLLGGFRIRVGDRLIDNSVASRLQALRETITSAMG